MAWVVENVTQARDITSVVRPVESFRLAKRHGSQVLDFRVTDTAASDAVAQDDVIRVTHDAVEVYEGIAKIVKHRDMGLAGIQILDVSCSDYNILLDMDVIETAGSRSVAESDKDRITWLVDTFGTKGVVAGAFVQELLADIPGGEDGVPRQDLGRKSLAKAIQQVARLTGGKLYVDRDKELHYYLDEALAAPFNLSDTPDESATRQLRKFTLTTDSLGTVHRVFVQGAEGILTTSEVAVLPPEAQVKEAIIVDTDLTSEAQAQAVGDAYLVGHGADAAEASCEVLTPGLEPGQTIQVTHALHGLAAQEYVISEVIVTLTSIYNVRYEVGLGQLPADIGSLVGGAASTAAGAAAAASEAGGQLVDLSVGGANQVRNSSFENADTSDWTVGANWTFGYSPVDPEFAFEREKVARATAVAAVVGDLVTDAIPVAADDDYWISAWSWMRAWTSGVATIEVREYDAGDVLQATTVIATIGAAQADWTRYSKKFGPNDQLGRTAWDPDTTYVRVAAYASSGTLTWDVDGVQVERGGLLTAFAPRPAELVDNSVGTTKISNDAVTTEKIIANAVVAGKIAAGTITAEKLAATLILASLIKTAEDGNRVEIDPDGIRLYDSAGALLVNMPTDGSDVYINANVLAKSLIVSGDATLQGTGNELAAASVTALASFQTDPSVAPELSQGWASVTLPANATYDVSASSYLRAGLDYDPAGGAGGATKVFWTISGLNPDGNYRALELLASDRTVNRQINLGGFETTLDVCRHKTWVYVLKWQSSAGFFVERYLASNLSFVDLIFLTVLPVEPGVNPRICSDGTNPYIVDKGTGNSTIRWQKYDDDMNQSGASIDTGYNPASDDFVAQCAAGNFDFGAFRIVVSTQLGGANAQAFDSTGARQANEQFPILSPSSSSGGLTYGDALGDGARFWSYPYTTGAVVPLIKHSTWTWTSASSVYWVGYTWYDSAGTTHETLVSPRASITMGRRKQLTVTVPPIPGAGGADDPNNVRAYMFPNATAPATTSLDLQATFAAISVTLTTYDSGGAAPPTSNGFSTVSVPATLKAQGEEWILKGSGEVLLKEISSPATPPSGWGRPYAKTTGLFYKGDDGVEKGPLSNAIVPVLSENYLVNDVTMTNANQAYDGPSLSLVAGTYILMGGITIVVTNAGGAYGNARLVSGSTVLDERDAFGLQFYSLGLAVHGMVTLTEVTTVKIQGIANNAGAQIRAESATNGTADRASHLIAIRIA